MELYNFMHVVTLHAHRVKEKEKDREYKVTKTVCLMKVYIYRY